MGRRGWMVRPHVELFWSDLGDDGTASGLERLASTTSGAASTVAVMARKK